MIQANELPEYTSIVRKAMQDAHMDKKNPFRRSPMQDNELAIRAAMLFLQYLYPITRDENPNMLDRWPVFKEVYLSSYKQERNHE
jgi:hypothetical protein